MKSICIALVGLLEILLPAFVAAQSLAPPSNKDAQIGTLAPGTGGVLRLLSSKLSDITSVMDYGAAGNFVVGGRAGADNAAALTNALSRSKALWLPAGNYRFTGYSLLTTLLTTTVYGPGQLFYDNGTFVAPVGSTMVAGHSDPGANFGTNISGGLLLGSEGMQSAGSLLQSTGPAWPTLVPRRLGNPMQLAVYPNSYDGLGTVAAGGNVITLTYGYMRASDFDVGDQFFAGGVLLQIASITQSGGNVLTITAVNAGGSAYTFPTTGQIGVHHVYEYAEFTGNVSGAAVTRTSGDFINVSGPVFTTVRVNGTLYTQSGAATDTSHLTLTSSAGSQTNVQIRQKVLASYLTMFRWQGLRGGSETNVQSSTTAYDTWELRSTWTGLGFPLPMYFGTGYATSGALNNNVVMETDGTTRIGGKIGQEAIEIVGSQSAATNRFVVTPGGNTPLPSQSPTLSVNGPNANINTTLSAKGSGTVTIASPLQLATSTVETLPSCGMTIKGSMMYVTDALSPTYNGAIKAGGAVSVPVFCNGSNWTAH